MNLKKNLFVIALASAASVSAQQAIPVPAPAPVAEPAPAVEQAQPAYAEPTNAVEPQAYQQEAPAPEYADPAAVPAEGYEPATEKYAPAEQAAPAPEFVPMEPVPEQTAAPQPEPQPAQQQPAPAFIPEPAPEPAPVLATAPTPEPVVIPVDTSTFPVDPVKEPHPLDMLHGSAYNIVGNQAAPNTVSDNIALPHKMHGLKFGYFEPVENSGAVAFGENSTYFIALDNSQDLGLLTAGMAFNSIGFYLNAAVGKNWNYAEYADYEQTAKSTEGGTLVGGAISFKASYIDVGFNLNFVRPKDIAYYSSPDTISEARIWDLGGTFTLSKTNNPKFAWALNISAMRHNAELETTTKSFEVIDGQKYIVTHNRVTADTTAHFELVPEFNVGSNILKSEKARIFLGLNTALPFVVFDPLKHYRGKQNLYGLYTAPNILGEVALGSHIMAFASANHTWRLFSFEDFKLHETTIQSIDITSGKTDVNLGARFQYECAALEMVFTKQFLKNPFGSFSDHSEMAVSIGGFIMF
ncbi:hypothetical protein SAMN05720471_11942 [Fibrobacter sp. UWP2]|nr:hypothetical protein SAMN05720471_11942 [Fibrobacter sp. UWP2]